MSGETQGRPFDGQQAVHIGPGNFSLSHIIPFFDQIGLDVRAISLRSDTSKKLLQDSDYDYTLAARDPHDFFEATRITALKEIVNVPRKADNAPEEIIDERRRQAVSMIGDPKTSIVTMTVTITGYGFKHDPSKRVIDPVTGAIVAGVPDSRLPGPILNEQEEKDAETTIAYIVAGLNERLANGAGPVVVMSLDNLPGNGTHLYRAVKDFALQHYGNELYDWIKANTFFPDTMVDRIAPLRDEAMIDRFVDGTGVENSRSNVVVVTEKLPKRALVISTPEQSAFELGRPLNPAFDNHPILEALTKLPGIEQCSMANLYAERKVHVFNGAHFGLALVGRLAGHQYAHDGINDAAVKEFVEKLLGELSMGVHSALSDDNSDYIQEFIDRVGNPHMMDELKRIGRNGSSKLYERVLIPWHVAVTAKPESFPHEAIDTVGSAWIRYIAKAAEERKAGRVFDVKDENAERLGLLGQPPELYKDAHSILGKEGVMEQTPGREAFGSDINSAFKELDRVLVNSARGAVPPGLKRPGPPFERPFGPDTDPTDPGD